MLIRIRKKGQITLPVDAVHALNLKEGTLLECMVRSGNIILLPHNKSCSKQSNSKIFTSESESAIPQDIPSGFFIQCFNRFCLYLDGIPIPLSHKAGELLALLSCERGGPLKKHNRLHAMARKQ